MAESQDSSPSDREPTKEELLDRALESPITELPENIPKGWLGERNIDLRKPDDFTPDLNAGLLQENDTQVQVLAILLGYLVLFVPGFVILWMSKRITLKSKIVWSIVMAAGVVGFTAYLRLRR